MYFFICCDTNENRMAWTLMRITIRNQMFVHFIGLFHLFRTFKLISHYEVKSCYFIWTEQNDRAGGMLEWTEIIVPTPWDIKSSLENILFFWFYFQVQGRDCRDFKNWCLLAREYFPSPLKWWFTEHSIYSNVPNFAINIARNSSWSDVYIENHFSQTNTFLAVYWK